MVVDRPRDTYGDVGSQYFGPRLRKLRKNFRDTPEEMADHLNDSGYHPPLKGNDIRRMQDGDQLPQDPNLFKQALRNAGYSDEDILGMAIELDKRNDSKIQKR